MGGNFHLVPLVDSTSKRTHSNSTPSHEPGAVLSVFNLRKNYGATTAVDDVSFEVRPNEIVGLLGPNGAGKTTTINMILGVLEPTQGSIHIEGINIAARRGEALERTNFAAVYAPLPGNLTIEQNLRVFARLYGVINISERVETLMREFEIEKFRRVKCGLLSSGEQSRLSLAKAMLNEPHLLLLDEPTASLDPSVAKEVRDKIRRFAGKSGTGILWTSHNMREVEEVCHRVLFLSHGKILLEGNPQTLPNEHGKSSLEELFIAVAREPLTLGGA
ncbi:MAG: Lipopolysaccharide export system ATP-binding protein LptB [Elusimicrobia bacterium]|nr:Lipopolysaccharide export system ATP-binding protein LptB [Elusimicrobiota bacterium]